MQKAVVLGRKPDHHLVVESGGEIAASPLANEIAQFAGIGAVHGFRRWRALGPVATFSARKVAGRQVGGGGRRRGVGRRKSEGPARGRALVIAEWPAVTGSPG